MAQARVQPPRAQRADPHTRRVRPHTRRRRVVARDRQPCRAAHQPAAPKTAGPRAPPRPRPAVRSQRETTAATWSMNCSLSSSNIPSDIAPLVVVDHQQKFLSVDLSVGPSVRSVDRSVYPTVARSFGRSIYRSVGRSIGRSVSLASLWLPVCRSVFVCLLPLARRRFSSSSSARACSRGAARPPRSCSARSSGSRSVARGARRRLAVSPSRPEMTTWVGLGRLWWRCVRRSTRRIRPRDEPASSPLSQYTS